MSDDKIDIELGSEGLRMTAEGQNSLRITEHLSDLVSPFSSAFGYIGDQIRIARQNSAIRAIIRAKEIASIEGIDIQPIPQKTLIKLIENTSMEEVDSDILEYWARLFVSSTRTEDALNTLFIEILGRMSIELANSFHDIGIRNCHVDPASPDYIARNEMLALEIANEMQDEYDDYRLSDLVNSNKILKHFRTKVNRYAWKQCIIERYTMSFSGNRYKYVVDPMDIVTKELLIREGLVRINTVDVRPNYGFIASIDLIELTVIGGLFANAICITSERSS